MVARGVKNSKDVVDLNAGFARPDPKLEKWQPDADNIPMAGNKIDSRFDPQNLLSAARRREAGRTMSSPELKSEASPKHNTKAVPKLPLDGKGKWGDWGVSASGASAYIQQQYEAKVKAEQQKATKDEMSAHESVPRDINGMNEVLAARSAANRARTSETYRNGTAPRATGEPQKRAVSEYIPPHLRRKQVEEARMKQMEEASKKQEVQPWATRRGRIANAGWTNKTLPKSEKQPWQNDPAPANPDIPLTVLAVADHEARRPSSVTLVNEEDDESLAMRLQLQEYSAELDAPAQDKKGVRFSTHPKSTPASTKPTLVIKAKDLYEQHHKVNELLWKQKALNVTSLTYSTFELYQMSPDRLESHLRTVRSLYDFRWNQRHETVQHIMKIQSEMNITHGQSPDDLLGVRGYELEQIKEAAFRAHKAWKNMSQDTDSLYTNDLGSTISITDAHGSQLAANHGKFEGHKSRDMEMCDAETGDVDMADDDDDEDLIVFSGRG